MAERRARIESAGAKLVYSGRLLDRRYDFPDRSMALRDHVLRLRIYENADGTQPVLDWKGETRYEHGYKVREEISTPAEDADALAQILEMLGYVVTIEVDRQIFQYELGEATVRFEEYPLMDPLVEVEGTAEESNPRYPSLVFRVPDSRPIASRILCCDSKREPGNVLFSAISKRRRRQ